VRHARQRDVLLRHDEQHVLPVPDRVLGVDLGGGGLQQLQQRLLIPSCGGPRRRARAILDLPRERVSLLV
jgi:hypothetical protein